MNQHLKFWGFLFFLSSTYSFAESNVKNDDSDPIWGLLNTPVEPAKLALSKTDQEMSELASAVFVITHEDIRRSGVTNVADALRLAPGMDVAQIDHNKWAVSSRGVNDRFANKLLVMIDGNSVYDPVFAGVSWNKFPVMLEDIKRIEIIRGPGSSLWGANAVNGVVNVITKHTSETEGGLFLLNRNLDGNGDITARYGKKLGKNTYMRAYVQRKTDSNYDLEDGTSAYDGNEIYRLGFNLDTHLTSVDLLNVNGGIYYGTNNQVFVMPVLESPYRKYDIAENYSRHHHLQANWQHTLDKGAEFNLSGWYHRALCKESKFKEGNERFNLDFQFNHAPTDKHRFVWGLGYRYTDYENYPYDFITFYDNRGHENLFSLFAQDEIQLLADKLWLTLGSKLEYSEVRGLDVQPSVRLLWAVTEQHKLWAAVSRAVRTPALFEMQGDLLRDVFAPENAGDFPTQLKIYGTPDLKPERLTAYELGYRFKPSDNFSTELSLFYNQYNDSIYLNPVGMSSDPTTRFNELTLTYDNTNGDYTRGAELSGKWQMSQTTRWHLTYSFIDEQYENLLSGTKTPQHQLALRGQFDLRDNVQADIWVRYVGERKPSANAGATPQSVDAYTGVDMRLAWQPTKKIELSLVGQNLLYSQHIQFRSHILDVIPTQVSRNIYLQLLWHF